MVYGISGWPSCDHSIGAPMFVAAVYLVCKIADSRKPLSDVCRKFGRKRFTRLDVVIQLNGLLGSDCDTGTQSKMPSFAIDFNASEAGIVPNIQV